jgi:hypothetical protein
MSSDGTLYQQALLDRAVRTREVSGICFGNIIGKWIPRTVRPFRDNRRDVAENILLLLSVSFAPREIRTDIDNLIPGISASSGRELTGQFAEGSFIGAEHFA